MGKIINNLDAALQQKQQEVEKINAGLLIERLAIKNYFVNNHKPRRPTKKKKKRK